MEIDISKLLKAILKGWKIVVATVAVFLVGAFIITKFVMTPMYKSSTTVYIGLTQSVSYQGITLERDMVSTYVAYLDSNAVLQDVCDMVNKNPKISREYTPAQVKSMQSAQSVNGTEILSISVSCADPEDAQIIADQLVASLEPVVNNMLDIKKYEILDYATLPITPSSPNLMTNLILSVLIAVVLSCGGIVLVELLDKRIKDEGELAEALDVPVIGIIPRME